MHRKLVPSATFINRFGVKDPQHKLLNILKLNGGTMSVEDLICENTDPHDVTVYTITDFLRDGLLKPEFPQGGDRQNDEAGEDPALRLRVAPNERICLTDSGKLALERSA